jgi:hypothetical protein
MRRPAASFLISGRRDRVAVKILSPSRCPTASLHIPDKPPVVAVAPVQPPASEAAEEGAGGERRLRVSPRGLWRGFKRLTQLGWPKSFPIVQFPNAPLIIAFLAGQAATQTHGTTHAYASAVSYLAMTIWAYEELVHGVNWFRRLLGLGYAISTIVHLAFALQS